jgi:hypothetical protein
MKNYRSSGNSSSLSYWVKIAIYCAIGMVVLNKIAGSATGIGDIFRRIWNPTTTEVQNHEESVFDNSTKGIATGSTWTPEKIRSDARTLTYQFKTYKGSWFWNHLTYWLDDTAFNIVKNYTNKPLKKALETAYRDLYTDGRDLNVDIEKYLSGSAVDYLRTKGII